MKEEKLQRKEANILSKIDQHQRITDQCEGTCWWHYSKSWSNAAAVSANAADQRENITIQGKRSVSRLRSQSGSGKGDDWTGPKFNEDFLNWRYRLDLCFRTTKGLWAGAEHDMKVTRRCLAEVNENFWETSWEQRMRIFIKFTSWVLTWKKVKHVHPPQGAKEVDCHLRRHWGPERISSPLEGGSWATSAARTQLGQNAWTVYSSSNVRNSTQEVSRIRRSNRSDSEHGPLFSVRWR